MATELAKAYVQIVPSALGIKGGIEKALGPELSTAGTSAGAKLGKFMAAASVAAIAAAGLGKVIGASITEGANLQQSLGGIETLFKGNADIVKKNAQQAFKTVGISANQYMEQVTSFSASLLQGLGGNTKKAAKVSDMAMRDMADNANKFGTDMGTIQAAYQGFAKQNYTMLDNLKLGYGGTKTEMERLLKDASKFSGQKYDINNLADVYSAIHVIQEEMGVTGTTAKEASSTFTGSFNAMKAATSNLLGALAMGEGVDTALQNLLSTIVTFVGGNLLPMVGTILQSIAQLIINNIGKVPDMLVKLSEIIMAKGPDILAAGLTMITQLAVGILKALPKIIGAVQQIIIYAGIAILKGVGKFLAAGAKWVWGLTSGIRGKIAGVISAVAQIPAKAVSKIKSYVSNFKTLGSDLVRGMIEGVKALVGSFGSAIADMVKSGLSRGKKTAKTGSPSKLFRDDLGKWLPLGAAEGVKKYTYALDNAVADMVADSLPAAQKAIPTDFAGRDITAGVSDSVVNGLATLAGAGAQTGGTIEVQAYLYPNGPSAGKAVYDLNNVWAGRLSNGR